MTPISHILNNVVEPAIVQGEKELSEIIDRMPQRCKQGAESLRQRGVAKIRSQVRDLAKQNRDSDLLIGEINQMVADSFKRIEGTLKSFAKSCIDFETEKDNARRSWDLLEKSDSGLDGLLTIPTATRVASCVVKAIAIPNKSPLPISYSQEPVYAYKPPSQLPNRPKAKAPSSKSPVQRELARVFKISSEPVAAALDPKNLFASVTCPASQSAVELDQALKRLQTRGDQWRPVHDQVPSPLSIVMDSGISLTKKAAKKQILQWIQGQFGHFPVFGARVASNAFSNDLSEESESPVRDRLISGVAQAAAEQSISQQVLPWIAKVKKLFSLTASAVGLGAKGLERIAFDEEDPVGLNRPGRIRELCWNQWMELQDSSETWSVVQGAQVPMQISDAVLHGASLGLGYLLSRACDAAGLTDEDFEAAYAIAAKGAQNYLETPLAYYY